jgi:predicted nuclease of restriction endonuclease-like (RecB) superfamily
MDTLINSSEYKTWLKKIKERISQARIRSATAANQQLILFYWELGQLITQKLEETSWRSKIINQLSNDLKHEFPEIQGFSRRNLY